VDDKAPFRAILWKASLPVSSEEAGGTYAARGILRIVATSARDAAIETFDEDKSLRVAETIIEGIRDFCTRDGELKPDEALVDHILKNTRSFVADGCASVVKTGRILRDRWMPNIASRPCNWHVNR
jgi:hypothetical protein